jgi:hypothetical protein
MKISLINEKKIIIMKKEEEKTEPPLGPYLDF